MKLITSNDELEVSQFYWVWIKPHIPTSESIKRKPLLCQCVMNGSHKAVMIGTMSMWCDPKNSQLLNQYDVVGPADVPEFDQYKHF